MNVFVTGGSGFVGEAVLEQLHATGHRCRLLVRHPHARPVQVAVAHYGLELHHGDVTDPSSLAGALTGIEAVIHLVGIISEAGQATFERVHVEGTRNLLAAALAAGVGRFVHMSALGTRPHAVSRYHKSKWAAEELVRGAALDSTLFRPSLIFGPHDQFVNLFSRLIRFSPVVPLLGNPGARFQPVAVETVAAAFVRCLSQPGSVGRTFDLCGPDTFTLSQMIDILLRAMRRKRLKWRVPPALSRSQAALLEFLYPTLLRRPPPLNRDQLLMLQEDNLGDMAPAESLLGLAPISFTDYLQRVNAPQSRK